MYNKKYRKDYGQMVICADSRNVWRYKEFEYYKYQRKLDRKKREVIAEQNGQNWTDIFNLMDDLLQDIRENFPWKVVKVDECEGDDIIGALACRTQEFGKYEPVMIVSTDGDFKQLQKFDNISQFAPMQKKLVVEKNPRKYQLEHICRGDKGDGIPNIKSGDDLFTTPGARQTPIMKKEIDLWFDNVDNLRSVMTEEQYRNYQRNKLLIDLESIPTDIYNSIIETYDEHKPANKMKVLNYLIKKRLRNLVECTEDFYNG